MLHSYDYWKPYIGLLVLGNLELNVLGKIAYLTEYHGAFTIFSGLCFETFVSSVYYCHWRLSRSEQKLHMGFTVALYIYSLFPKQSGIRYYLISFSPSCFDSLNTCIRYVIPGCMLGYLPSWKRGDIFLPGGECHF